MEEERSRNEVEIIENTEQSILEYENMFWAHSDHYITEEQLKQLMHGKLLALNTGEYSLTIKLGK
ncbi:hypothetical protein [Paraclostridium bifermentans]|uniref:hypothetical protein n=1 Tax=Paraclostridium bifermentans TaxID=1490 RepID=UPI00374EC547